MNLLTLIKNSTSDVTINNLANYLGEDLNGTKIGLDLGVNSFLASIIKFASTEKAAKSLLGILNDGGHTGDILNNIESFSGNTEKSKLLETIGSNIVNHFLESKAGGVSEKISEIGGIKNSSSSALLSFGAPLVLGALGKIVRERNMNAADLKNYLSYQGDEVSGMLPGTISNFLNLPKYTKASGTPFKHNQAVSDLNKDNERKGINWGLILPWILLFLVGALIYYYTGFNKNPKSDKAVNAVTDTLHPEEFLPIDTLSKVDNKAKTDTVKVVKPVTPKSIEPSVVTEKVEKLKEVTPKAEKKESPKVAPATPQASAVKPKKESVKSNIPKGLSEIGGNAFSKNSAEITNSNSLKSLVNRLKEGSAKVTITPLSGAVSLGVDRAYAIRDFLLENGVALNQIEIGSAKSGNSGSGVAYKIID